MTGQSIQAYCRTSREGLSIQARKKGLSDQDGTVGSVIVAREDRLFRDRFLTQVTQFAEACAKRGVILIVAGRRCYDFRIQDDFNAFIDRMRISTPT